MAYSHNIYAAFKRLTNKPLDPSGIFDSLEKLRAYVESDLTTAYVGQYLVVTGESDDAGIYFIYSSKKFKKVLDEEKINELIDSKLIPVNDEIKANSERIDGIVEDITQINNNIENVRTEISEKYDEVNKKIEDEVDKILGGIDDTSLDTIKELADKIKYIEDNTDPDKIDSIRELADWIKNHGDDTAGALELIKSNEEKIAALEEKLGNLDNSLAERVDKLEKTLKENIEIELAAVKTDIESIKKDYAKKSEVSEYLVGVERKFRKTFNITGNAIVSVSDMIPVNARVSEIILNIDNISSDDEITAFSLKGTDNNQVDYVFAELDNENVDGIITEVGLTTYKVSYTVISEGFTLFLQVSQSGTISGSVDVVYIK